MNGIPEIRKIEVDLDVIAKFESEENFIKVAVDLLVETNSYVHFLGKCLPYNTKAWNSDQAVVGGHFVRLFKLISAMLDQTFQSRREIAFMFARMAFECIINTSYILKNYSPELIFSYKSYSLKHEKKLMNRINDNIKQRNGEVLPIEDQMLKSINRSFKVSGVEAEQVKVKEPRNWGNKNIYEKAEDVGLGKAYLAVFSGPSHSIHGNWQDLLDYHLESYEQGYFTPCFEWHPPRPQFLTVVAQYATDVSKQYVTWLGFQEIEHLIKSLDELQERVLKLDFAHEQWLNHDA